jgi:hypothetical protein
MAPVRFDFADACHADSPWHETMPRRFHRAYCHQGLQFMAGLLTLSHFISLN